MKITIEFKPDCSLQDKLEALNYLKHALEKDVSNRIITKTAGSFDNHDKLDNGYSIQITE